MHRYEELMCAAHAAGATLIADMRQLQASMGLTAITGHSVFARFDEAQAQVSSAIGAAAAGHRLARTLAPAIGFDVENYGETTDPQAIATAPLRQVA
jgi:hypothetical protein